VKRQISLLSCFALLALIPGVVTSTTAKAQTAPTKPLTIETLYQPGGLAGRAPETVEWSPDGTKLTFVQRDGKGEKGELWYVDISTGEKKVLVSAAKLAALDPDVNKVKNEREQAPEEEDDDEETSDSEDEEDSEDDEADWDDEE